MARIDWIEYRLLNWARWKLQADRNPLGHATVNLQSPVVDGGPGYDDAPIPTNAIEAGETDSAIKRLQPPELARTLTVYYVGGGTIKRMCEQLRCSTATLYARRDQAHLQLARYLNERQATARQERARVEALQASIRPAGSFTE